MKEGKSAANEDILDEDNDFTPHFDPRAVRKLAISVASDRPQKVKFGEVVNTSPVYNELRRPPQVKCSAEEFQKIFEQENQKNRVSL